MELENDWHGVQSAHVALQNDLHATQDKVASLHSELKEKTACNDILRQQYDSTKEVSRSNGCGRSHLNHGDSMRLFFARDLFADNLLLCVCMCDISIDIDYVY